MLMQNASNDAGRADTLATARVGLRSSGSWWVGLRAVLCGLVVIYMIVPLVIVLIISFSSAAFLQFPPPGLSLTWYENLFDDPVWMRSLMTSVKVLVPTAVLATVMGTAAAYGLARSRIPGASLITGFLMAPVVVPVIITAAGIYGVFGGFGLNGTLQGLIIAHTVLTIPYVVATVSASLKVMDRRLEEAALTLGAMPLTCFRRITLPLIFPAVLSGLLFAMVMSFDELIVSLFISTPTVRPVTVQMWSNVRGDVDPTIAAVAMLLFLFSLGALLVDHFFRHRSRTDRSVG